MQVALKRYSGTRSDQLSKYGPTGRAHGAYSHGPTVPGIFTGCLQISKIKHLSFYKLPRRQSLKDMDRRDKVNTMDSNSSSIFKLRERGALAPPAAAPSTRKGSVRALIFVPTATVSYSRLPA